MHRSSTHVCAISGQPFVVSAQEWQLRAFFGFTAPPLIAPHLRFRELGAFWPHWTMHRRTCDRSRRDIISIFRPDCLYPVWNRDDWIAHAEPPQAEFNFARPFFEQAWALFPRCPLPHTFQNHNQNCEYADDLFYSKNCYLCHSGATQEDCRYNYYVNQSKDSQYCVFSQFLELCSDAVHCSHCYRSNNLAYCRQVHDSSFLYDCRNCSDCMFCSNLRGAQYCFDNVQLSKEEYKKKCLSWDLRSHDVYIKAQEHYRNMLLTSAWHREAHIDMCQDSYGNYLRQCKECEDCYMITEHEQCIHNAISGPGSKTTLDCMGSIGGQVSFYTVMCVYCYETKFSFELHECRFCDYCAYCFQCKNCFGCCGLVGEEFCIFNRKYSREEYERLRERIIKHMHSTGEWGRFFPGHFAPNPYTESCSGFYFPLPESEQDRLGFRTAPPLERKDARYQAIGAIPDRASDITDFSAIFWDEQAARPFSITKEDVANSIRLDIPPPHSFYMTRIQENFALLPFHGKLRETRCAKTGRLIHTAWPAEFDRRILNEQAYQDLVLGTSLEQT